MIWLFFINFFQISFIGNIGALQNPMVFIETMRLLSNNNQVHFLFIGDGIMLPELKSRVAELTGVPNDRQKLLCKILEVHSSYWTAEVTQLRQSQMIALNHWVNLIQKSPKPPRRLLTNSMMKFHSRLLLSSTERCPTWN